MTTTLAVSCAHCVKAGGVFQRGQCRERCGGAFYSEKCFTSEAECSQYRLYTQTKKVCQKATTCTDCLRAHKFCGWASGHPIEWGSQPRCIVAPLWDWEYGPEFVVKKLKSCASPTTITASSPVCAKCGKFKQTGIVSCCARGGSWFKTCGKGSKFQHTWGEGEQACKGQFNKHSCACWRPCRSWYII